MLNKPLVITRQGITFHLKGPGLTQYKLSDVFIPVGWLLLLAGMPLLCAIFKELSNFRSLHYVAPLTITLGLILLILGAYLRATARIDLYTEDGEKILDRSTLPGKRVKMVTGAGHTKRVHRPSRLVRMAENTNPEKIGIPASAPSSRRHSQRSERGESSAPESHQRSIVYSAVTGTVNPPEQHRIRSISGDLTQMSCRDTYEIQRNVSCHRVSVESKGTPPTLPHPHSTQHLELCARQSETHEPETPGSKGMSMKELLPKIEVSSVKNKTSNKL